MNQIARLLPVGLLLLSVALAAWGALGLLEYVFPAITLGLQNAAFPAGLQFLHFLSILVTGSVFAAGYMLRWPATPIVTIGMYAILATLCFIETVDFGAFGGGPMRFIVMAAEFAVYLGLSAYLLRSTAMQARFRSDPRANLRDA